METREELYERIERYLADEMTPAERTAFELEVAGDPELAREVEIHADLARNLYDPEAEKLRVSIQRVMRYQAERPTIPFIHQHYRQLVAACIVLIVVTIGIVQLTPRPTGPELFAEYFEPYPDVLTTRNAADWDPRVLEAMARYNRQDYAGAAILFKEAVDSGVDNDLVMLYYGVSELALGHGEKAVEVLKRIQADMLLKEDIQWYLALGYLLNKDEKQAGPIFESLVEKKGQYGERALEVINQFKR